MQSFAENGSDRCGFFLVGRFGIPFVFLFKELVLDESAGLVDMSAAASDLF